MKYAVVVCARTNSSRTPGKIFRHINGMTMLDHLISRISKRGHPMIVAVPGEEEHIFKDRVPYTMLFPGVASDPMLRTLHAGKSVGADYVVRITADKIFIESDIIHQAIQQAEATGADYLYGPNFTPGTRFEVIKMDCLERATQKFKDVEHTTYAVQAVANSVVTIEVPKRLQSSYNFLLDYPDDFALMETILQANGNGCTLEQAIEWMNRNPWAQKLSKKPLVTVYTSAYNSEKWIEKCMGSVSEQVNFKDIEYILIDDFSSDRTFGLMAKFKTKYANVTLVRNHHNSGLSYSSNLAVALSRGSYIIRLDSDDYFASNQAVLDLHEHIKKSQKDAVYPANFFGSYNVIQHGHQAHHVGGAIFSSKALEHLKFNEGLRGYEGYDLFKRARNVLNIGYYEKPTFFYRQRADSMSHTNLEDRARIKERIDAQETPRNVQM